MTTLGISGNANAADFSLRGTFDQDADVELFEFSVSEQSTVILRTFSYGGGTQADGTEILPGGFDPVLTLFDGDGNLLFLNDDDTTGTVARDEDANQAYDSLLEAELAAGNYTLALTQYANFAVGNNLSDGFIRTGNFTGDLFARCAPGSVFCDFAGNVRTNVWAFDAIGVLPPKEPDQIDKPKPVPGDGDGPIGNGNPPPTPPVTPPTPPVTPPTPPIDNPTQVPEPTTTAAFLLAGLGALVKGRRKG